MLAIPMANFLQSYRKMHVIPRRKAKCHRSHSKVSMMQNGQQCIDALAIWGYSPLIARAKTGAAVLQGSPSCNCFIQHGD